MYTGAHVQAGKLYQTHSNSWEKNIYVHVQKNTYYMYTLMTSDLYEYFWVWGLCILWHSSIAAQSKASSTRLPVAITMPRTTKTGGGTWQRKIEKEEKRLVIIAYISKCVIWQAIQNTKQLHPYHARYV